MPDVTPLVVMQRRSFQSFLSGGCHPACHICGVYIETGQIYVMRPIAVRGENQVEMMVCHGCRSEPTPKPETLRAQRELSLVSEDIRRRLWRVNRNKEIRRKKREREGEEPKGCIVVNGRIIPGLA